MAKPLYLRGVLGLLAGLSALALVVSSAAADEAEAHYRIGLNHKRKGETPRRSSRSRRRCSCDPITPRRR